MSDRELLDIIESLKSLQIQQQQLIERQQALTQQLDHILVGRAGDMVNPHRDGDLPTPTTNPSIPHRDEDTSPVISGRISPIISHGNTTRPPNIIPTTGPSTRRRTFIIGEHVYITNRISHSLTPGPLDRAAVVTRMRPRRINFRTYSGHEIGEVQGICAS